MRFDYWLAAEGSNRGERVGRFHGLRIRAMAVTAVRRNLEFARPLPDVLLVCEWLCWEQVQVLRMTRVGNLLRRVFC